MRSSDAGLVSCRISIERFLGRNCVTIEAVDSYLTVVQSDISSQQGAIMSDKKKNEKSTPQPDTKADKKASETVHLSAEELRKISGGANSGGKKPTSLTACQLCSGEASDDNPE